MMKLIPIIPFSTNIGANTKMNIEASLCNSFYEFNEVLSPFKIILHKENYNKLINFSQYRVLTEGNYFPLGR